jgi:outer membrane protein insertion porin family
MDLHDSRDKLIGRLLPLLLLAVVISLLAGPARAQQYKIVDIRVTGIVHSTEEMVKNTAALRIGTDLTGVVLQEAVKNLYATGIFKDIVIDAEPVTAGVIVTINVVEYPLLSAISFKGNKKISEKDLKELIKLAPNGYISDNLMMQSKDKIEAEYMSKGYFLARVDPVLNYAADSATAELIFNIREYGKVKVSKVFLTGNKRLKAKDIVNKMSNRKHGFLRSSDFRKEKYPEDKEKIIQYCNKEGFVDAYIVSDSFVIDTAVNRMKIYIDIYEGPRYYFGTSTFSGNDVYSDDILQKTLKYKPGEVFNEEVSEESTGELYSAYHEKGYLHARILDERHTRDTTINLEYAITEGLPSEVRLIDVEGNSKTKEKVIRRELMIHPGETFHRSALMRSLREVMQLNYFNNVVPDVRDLPSGDVDLVIKVEEKPTGQVSAGAGYSGQDKLVGNFGLGIPNFRGNGQSVNISVDFGSRRNSISLGFTEPWFMGTPTSVGGDLYNLNRRWYDDFTEGRRGGTIRLGRRLRWPDNYFRLYWRYRLENVRYYDFSNLYELQNGDSVVTSNGQSIYLANDNSLQSFGEKWLTTSATGFTIERDSRDLPMFATSGARISYTGDLAGGFLGGQWKYYKHLFSAQKYLPTGWGTALVGSFKFGYISAVSNDRIPYSERFTPGGTDPDGLVRGYPDASLTPRNSAGALLGGMSEAIYNLEWQIPILPNQMYALAFADAGTSWISKNEIKPFSGLYRGAGFGFRLVVPGVGVIGFDFGYSFDLAYGEKRGWRPHFQIGQGF